LGSGTIEHPTHGNSSLVNLIDEQEAVDIRRERSAGVTHDPAHGDEAEALPGQVTRSRMPQIVESSSSYPVEGMHHSGERPRASVPFDEAPSKLADLRDRDVLTDQEFAAEKRKLLD
jgi:hypothetical protein